ncbi:MAG: penicillin-binding transpeptidase domain-containing protein, partial [Patescibacteria group bacterium]
MNKRFRPGVSFSDFVVRDSMSRRSKVGDEREERDFRRGWMLIMIVIAGFGLLWVRLVVLQGFYGERYRVLSDQNRVKKIKLSAPRGTIFDRNNLAIAKNHESGTMPAGRQVMNNGIEIKSYVREYPFGEAVAHVTGFLGRAGETEVGLIKSLERKYDADDLVGRAGLELQYEELLRGEDGGKLIEVDNMGGLSRDLGNKNPVAGTDLKTSIDGALSRVALDAMGGKKGAVIVSDPNTGEILALVSSPSFDPTKIADYLTSHDLPMFNRAISGVYPPGSTFKMITMVAAVDSGKVDLGYTYEDHGVIKVGDFSYTNWLFTKRGRTEGIVGFEKGLAHSVDTFFYKIGEMTSPQVMADWSYKFGLGDLTGIDLPGEVGGLVATPDWKEKTKGEKWFLGNTYHMAIGQGDLLTTPLQVNLMTNVLAT